MHTLSILGSTGSIGTQTLDIVRQYPDRFQVMGLAAHSNTDLLHQQIIEFQPKYVTVYDPIAAATLRRQLNGSLSVSIEILEGEAGLLALATLDEAKTIVTAVSGTIGIKPTAAAAQKGKRIALANKEALVSAGHIITQEARKSGATILPVDSEHSAIFQCLQGIRSSHIHRLILTASGGPFRSYSLEELQHITPEHALSHPTWNMGKKITIDSSTLMNKGLEMIEASWLFHLPAQKIDVLIHPQSIIHSMVECIDGSILSQMGTPHMITPIQYALTYPERLPTSLPYMDWKEHPSLTFGEPNRALFRCLDLAYKAIECGGSLPCYMNAANEVLVHRFLNKEISWLEISQKLEQLMSAHSTTPALSLDEILAVDALGRKEAVAI